MKKYAILSAAKTPGKKKGHAKVFRNDMRGAT